LGEGTDSTSRDEIFRLRDLAALQPGTVLVHAVGLDAEGWELVRRSGAAVVWCPRSNLFTLGATLDIRKLLAAEIPVAIATDSPLTAAGDLLDEMRFAMEQNGLSSSETLALASTSAARLLGVTNGRGDYIAVREFGAPPDAVVIGGRLRLVSAELAFLLPGAERTRWSPLRIYGRPPVLVPFPVRALIEQTRAALGEAAIYLGGRQVIA
jgi:cytosine/adenosine deaminase-related metal-dependent hydrolase